MDLATAVPLITNVGFPIALAIILLRWIRTIQAEAVDRERRLGERIDELENRDYTVLMEEIAESTAARKETYRSLRRLTGASNDMLTALKARPCLTDDSFYPHQTLHADHPLPRVECPTGDTTEETSKAHHRSKST